ncbi:hypothetical protein J6590_031247 [Homalodisca vitripennis]|nr:hypothetical protein J6590_031247 [Homalodisca vitripennis]
MNLIRLQAITRQEVRRPVCACAGGRWRPVSCQCASVFINRPYQIRWDSLLTLRLSISADATHLARARQPCARHLLKPSVMRADVPCL